MIGGKIKSTAKKSRKHYIYLQKSLIKRKRTIAQKIATVHFVLPFTMCLSPAGET